jgi:hypothetical protein
MVVQDDETRLQHLLTICEFIMSDKIIVAINFGLGILMCYLIAQTLALMCEKVCW